MRQFLLVNNLLETSSVATEDVNHLVREAGVYTADAALPAAETEKPVAEAVAPEASPTSTEASSTTTEASSTTTDTPAVSETENRKLLLKKWPIYQPMKKTIKAQRSYVRYLG